MEFANNYEDFIRNVIKAEVEALNSENGKKYMADLLEKAKADNPNLTPEEWSKIKQQFLVYVFAEMLKDNEDFQSKFMHIWRQETGVETEE